MKIFKFGDSMPEESENVTLHKHSFLSPSSYQWLDMDEENLQAYIESKYAKYHGVFLHSYAETQIRLGRIPKVNSFLNAYIHDCIKMGMETEVELGDEYVFGTADAFKYDKENDELYIFDLKNGRSPAMFTQLFIYAALFSIEIKHIPKKTIVRIYQDDIHESIVSEDTIGLYVAKIEKQKRILKKTCVYLAEKYGVDNNT